MPVRTTSPPDVCRRNWPTCPVLTSPPGVTAMPATAACVQPGASPQTKAVPLLSSTVIPVGAATGVPAAVSVPGVPAAVCVPGVPGVPAAVCVPGVPGVPVVPAAAVPVSTPRAVVGSALGKPAGVPSMPPATAVPVPRPATALPVGATTSSVAVGPGAVGAGGTG